jgi:hypothetical protein
VHQAVNGRALLYLANLLTTVASVLSRVSLPSAGREDLIPATRLKLGNQAFSVSGPTAFSDLPTEFKTCTNTAVFKRKLETFLFNKAYDVA